MAVCRVAMLSYVFGEKCSPSDLYSAIDLADVSMYCAGLIEQGYSREPHDGFSLAGFIEWAKPFAATREQQDLIDWRRSLK